MRTVDDMRHAKPVTGADRVFLQQIEGRPADHIRKYLFDAAQSQQRCGRLAHDLIRDESPAQDPGSSFSSRYKSFTPRS